MRNEYPNLRCNSDSENINQNAFYSLLVVTNNKFIITGWLVLLFPMNQKSNAKMNSLHHFLILKETPIIHVEI